MVQKTRQECVQVLWPTLIFGLVSLLQVVGVQKNAKPNSSDLQKRVYAHSFACVSSSCSKPAECGGG
jgi:hypothetical protein